jgi:hypothetical protein
MKALPYRSGYTGSLSPPTPYRHALCAVAARGWRKTCGSADASVPRLQRAELKV